MLRLLCDDDKQSYNCFVSRHNSQDASKALPRVSPCYANNLDPTSMHLQHVVLSVKAQ